MRNFRYVTVQPYQGSPIQIQILDQLDGMSETRKTRHQGHQLQLIIKILVGM